MAEPTTPAGRALLRWAEAMDKRLAADIGLGADYHGTAQVIEESVELIAAEARADLLDRLAAGVRDLIDIGAIGDFNREAGVAAFRAAVLALIRDEEADHG